MLFLLAANRIGSTAVARSAAARRLSRLTAAAPCSPAFASPGAHHALLLPRLQAGHQGRQDVLLLTAAAPRAAAIAHQRHDRHLGVLRKGDLHRTSVRHARSLLRYWVWGRCRHRTGLYSNGTGPAASNGTDLGWPPPPTDLLEGPLRAQALLSPAHPSAPAAPPNLTCARIPGPKKDWNLSWRSSHCWGVSPSLF